MAGQWKAGDAVMDRARETGDYRGAMLQGAKRDAERMAERADGAILGSMAFAAVAMVGLIGAATAASGGLLGAAACAAIMQSCLGASGGGVLSAGAAKLWKSWEQRKAGSLAPAVRDLESGADPKLSIDFHLGEELAAKLGGWRNSKPTAPDADPRAPRA